MNLQPTKEMVIAGEVVILNTYSHDMTDPDLAAENATRIFNAMMAAAPDGIDPDMSNAECLREINEVLGGAMDITMFSQVATAINDRLSELKPELHNAGARFDGVKDKLRAAEKRVAELEALLVLLELQPAAADELRAQGVEIMKAKTLQSLERIRANGGFDNLTWSLAEQCLLGMVDGCDVVAKELRTGTLPKRFTQQQPATDNTAHRRLEKRLTTPVRLPDVLFIKVSGSAVPVMHAERVKERLRAAGVKIEGDE